MKKVLLFGDGGHAKVVKETLSLIPEYHLEVIADQKYKEKQILSNNMIVMPIEEALNNHDKYICFIAIGDNFLRAKIAYELERRRAAITTIIHPSAIISPTAKISKGTFISAKCLVQTDVRVGEFTIINSGAIIEHDCEIKSFSHLAPGSICTGNVQIGEKALVGAGVVITPGNIIGAEAIIGAGATVVSNIPARSTVVGSPAKSIKGRMINK